MLALFQETKQGLLLHVNRLSADDSHVIPSLIFIENEDIHHKICFNGDGRF